MAAAATIQGAWELLSRAVGQSGTQSRPLRLKLFLDTVVPKFCPPGTLTEPPPSSGYVDGGMEIGEWALREEPDRIVAVGQERTFRFGSGGFNVRGYFLETYQGGTVVWAEFFPDGPYYIPTGGGMIVVAPSISLPI